ncbi:MAG: P-loop containing nucleoside triphosphate hydrolase protein, partial [Monoraphidium minutum]
MQPDARPRPGAGGRARTRMVRIKVVSLGACGAGKSCLIKRYCEAKFVSKYIPTIGVDYGVKPVRLGDFEVRVNLWDMAGPDAYLEVRSEFYKDSQGALLVFDVNSRASFDALPAWLDEARRCGAPR